MKNLNLQVPNMFPRLVPGRYWTAFCTSFFTSTTGLNVISYIPIFVPKRSNFDRISLNTTAATGNIILGVYGNREITRNVGQPYNLILQTNSLPTVVGETFQTITLNLTEGNYWLACVASADIGCTCIGGNSLPSMFMGGFGDATGVNSRSGGAVNSTFGPLSAIAVNQTFYAVTPPAVMLRIA